MSASSTAFGVALGGLIALAAGLGVGRFAYTPNPAVHDHGAGSDDGGRRPCRIRQFFGHLLGALAAVWARMPGGRRAWLLGSLALSAVSTGAMGLTTAMAGFVMLRFAGGVSSALAIVLSTAIVLERLAACGRPGLSWMPYAGVGAGIALSAVLVAGLAAHGTARSTLWLASGALSLLGLLACAYLIDETPQRAGHFPNPRDAIMSKPRHGPAGAFDIPPPPLHSHCEGECTCVSGRWTEEGVWRQGGITVPSAAFNALTSPRCP